MTMSKAELVKSDTLPLAEQDAGASMFERMARDPSIQVDKLERLMTLWERSEARKAEALFNGAMSAAQTEMRPVAADANNPQTRSKYASYQALDHALRPIYTTHGFGLSFDTAEGAPQDWVRVLCYVTHTGGHSRTYHADIPADGKGAKGGDVMTKTHAVGSAMTYGMRYLLKMIFNVAVGEDDDDGQRAGGKVVPEAPEGFDDWLTDMTATADAGTAALQSAFKASKPEYRRYVTEQMADTWSGIKAKAAKMRS
jgi:hypothetical protein